ncbi:unnamed protein product, partial [Staurois parvus]
MELSVGSVTCTGSCQTAQYLSKVKAKERLCAVLSASPKSAVPGSVREGNKVLQLFIGVCVHVYVCMYMYLCVCLHVHVSVHVCICTCVRVHVQVSVCMCLCVC